MTVWEIVSVPFWLLAIYFAADAPYQIMIGKKGAVFPALLACGLFAYIAARMMS